MAAYGGRAMGDGLWHTPLRTNCTKTTSNDPIPTAICGRARWLPTEGRGVEDGACRTAYVGRPMAHLMPKAMRSLQIDEEGRLDAGFLEVQTRYKRFWRIFPAAAAYPLPARPGFTANGQTDGTGYMMACWVPGWSRPTQLRHIDNRFVPVRWDGRPDRLDPAFPDPRQAVTTPMMPEPLLIQRRLV